MPFESRDVLRAGEMWCFEVDGALALLPASLLVSSLVNEVEIVSADLARLEFVMDNVDVVVVDGSVKF